jgi:hypothetical protein
MKPQHEYLHHFLCEMLIQISVHHLVDISRITSFLYQKYELRYKTETSHLSSYNYTTEIMSHLSDQKP